MNRQVILASNVMSSNNTLAKFENFIPQSYLNRNIDWTCSVQSIGIDFKLKSPAAPKSEEIPYLLQISVFSLEQIHGIKIENLKSLPPTVFKYWNKYFLQPSENDYDAKKINNELRSQTVTYGQIDMRMFNGFLSKLDEQGSLEIGRKYFYLLQF